MGGALRPLTPTPMPPSQLTEQSIHSPFGLERDKAGHAGEKSLGQLSGPSHNHHQKAAFSWVSVISQEQWDHSFTYQM